MVTVTTSRDGADHAEPSLLQAAMGVALRGKAQVESVVIDQPSGFVAVTVRLSEGLTRAERFSRHATVRARLDVVIAETFTDEELVLAPVLVTSPRASGK